MSRQSFINFVAGMPRRSPSIRQIVRDVAAAYGVTPGEILGPNRQRRLVVPRQEAMRRASAAGKTLTQIGKVMGRDHTTIRHGIKRAEERKW